jgi:hypothetical protein
MNLTKFESVTKFRDAGRRGFEEVKGLRSNANRLKRSSVGLHVVGSKQAHPSLNCRALVGQEAKVEMARALPIECEPIRAL